jgi:hypothetical protein
VNHPKPRTGVCLMHQRDAGYRNKFAERNLMMFSATWGVCRRTAALFGPVHVLFCFPCLVSMYVVLRNVRGTTLRG